MTIGFANIYAMLGDADSALPLLEHSLSVRGGITVPRLRLDPMWDRIRNDPRFESLLQKYIAKA
ncbi:MAG: TPR end-of-group domain-containing protein [Chthoniobacterales bacterium]